MATAVRPKRPRPSRAKTPPRSGWWGRGAPPWEQFPGVTIRIDAEYSEERKRWESHRGKYYFDTKDARTKAEFFPACLTHHKGEFAAQPFELLDYQRLLVILPLFGWKHAKGPLAGLRRFRKVFLAVPKGNGKSPLGAGVGLVLTFVDGEEGAEVYSAAADKEQAAIVFDTARIMVESDPVLAERSNVLRRVIEVPDTHSYYKVLSADAKTKHGPNIHGLIFDEFHAQTHRDLFETLYRGTVKRRQPVTFMVTTAGDDDESICAEEWDYARRVQSGTITDESYLPVIFEASKDDDWKDPAVWRRVNPGFGVTVKADAIANEANAATNEPRKLNDFKRFHLNMWVNQAVAWIPVDWWDDRCNGPLSSDEVLRGLPVYAGLDMSQKYDLTALVLVFPTPLEGPPQQITVIGDDEQNEPVARTVSLNFTLDIVPHFWLPADTLDERVREDRVPYDQWERMGLLTVTEGNVIDYDKIVADITGPITARFPRLKGAPLGYDPAFATDIALTLQAKGYQTIEILQNYKYLSEPSHVFEALVKGGRVRHGGHRLLRQHVENVMIRSDDAGRIRPVKPKKRKRIDGVVGALMGVERLIRQPVETGSIYETQGLEFV